MLGSLVDHLSRLPREAALGWFLQAWHGIHELPQVPADPQVPPVLGQLLALKQPRPEVCSKQNHLVDPAEVDGLLGFYVENQAVYRWAYRAGEADPIVWGRYHHEDAWTAEVERLGGFLLQVCLFEAMFSAPYSARAACLAPDALPAVLGPLRPVLGPWRWPGAPTVFHASDGAIGMTCRNDVAGQVGLDVLLAARQLEPLAYLLNVIDENDEHWEHARLGELVL